MDPRSEVLLRQAELFGGRVLLAGLPADDLLGQLAGHRLELARRRTAAAGQALRRALLLRRCPAAGVFDTAVLFLPKSRELTDYLLQTLAARLPGRPLYLVGEKRGGIERAAKQLGSFGRARKLDSARHCQLWQVEVEQAPAAPDLDALASHFTLQLADGPLEVVSLPGVFSHGRLDLGSALLLEHLDNLPGGRLLDFGCGAGILGATLKRRYPQSELVLLDVDAFAVESSRRTLAANGLEAEVIAGDGIDAAPRQLAAIISNPPFHQGVHTSYQASETLIERAAEHLQASGEMRIVANAFLRYPPLIERHLGAPDAGRTRRIPHLPRRARLRPATSGCIHRPGAANSPPSLGSSLRRAPCSSGMRQHTWSADHGACDRPA